MKRPSGTTPHNGVHVIRAVVDDMNASCPGSLSNARAIRPRALLLRIHAGQAREAVKAVRSVVRWQRHPQIPTRKSPQPLQPAHIEPEQLIVLTGTGE